MFDCIVRTWGGGRQGTQHVGDGLPLFALIPVTTVGLGDIYPIDHLRLIAGIASLTSFILIRCTAQYFYKTMSTQEV